MKLAFKHAAAVIFLVLSITTPVTAESFDCSMQWKAVEGKALGAMVTGDYATALQLIRPLADCGVAEAQVYLGGMYTGAWGVPQDYVEALKWFQRAADQSYAEGQRSVGEMYYSGEGVSQNYADALKLFQRAADQENEYAQARLGDMYSNGEGVPQDYVRAYMWYLLAYAHNHVVGQPRLVRLTQLMTHEQMVEATKLSHEWKRARQPPR